jgi:hypothetical protein
MRIILRFLVFIATIVGVLALLVGGIFLGTGNLDFLERIGVDPTLGTLDVAPAATADAEVTDSASGTGEVLRFTWRGDEIIYNESAISEADFSDLLASARASEAKIEIVKMSDVRVESADRWREMLDTAGVRYEIIPQE